MTHIPARTLHSTSPPAQTSASTIMYPQGLRNLHCADQAGRRKMTATLPSVPRAIIIGGSTSGLLVGALLRQRGWHIDVFERSLVELAGRGAGIVCHPELF